MEAKNIVDVEKFVLACNDVLSGKFLDINKKLEQFLSVMTKSEDILDLLSECLEGFDEENDFVKAFSVDKKTGSVKVAIPTDDRKRLALSVTIFNDIINEKLNANQFLETFFQDKKLSPVQSFLEKIIRPFKDTICKFFEVDTNITAEEVRNRIEQNKILQEEEEKKVEQEQFPYLDQLLGEIVKTANQILALLKFEKKRTDTLDDLEFVVSSILQACEKRDLMVINGLVIGLNYVSKKFKNVRHLVEEMNSLIYVYYEYLASGIEENDE